MQVNACICGDIVNEMPLAQATVFQHLKELKNAGLIRGNIDGNTICYCIDEIAIEKMEHYFNNMRSILNTKKKSCC